MLVHVYISKHLWAIQNGRKIQQLVASFDHFGPVICQLTVSSNKNLSRLPVSQLNQYRACLYLSQTIPQ